MSVRWDIEDGVYRYELTCDKCNHVKVLTSPYIGEIRDTLFDSGWQIIHERDREDRLLCKCCYEEVV
ncbi:MAG: hypothetical protein NWF07_13810 [Candidatus Bathyarchaeota archaeon]|nr:hypothetical protein [Candidatus Bathyarchaeota archaeon]